MEGTKHIWQKSVLIKINLKFGLLPYFSEPKFGRFLVWTYEIRLKGVSFASEYPARLVSLKHGIRALTQFFRGSYKKGLYKKNHKTNVVLCWIEAIESQWCERNAYELKSYEVKDLKYTT